MSKNQNLGVRVWTENVIIPTYLPFPPDKNPMFLEKRVYQGSSGKVYPLPFTDRLSETKTSRAWKAVFLENEYLHVMILPEIGGRIHAILDKTNNYDLVYRQSVIKPALVGLAGSWISGGIEFNWAQHHRPATFLPVDFEIEDHADGSKTVWLSDHEPMSRMKGMHGVSLSAGKSLVELKVRVYNRTNFTQTFLWWANVATKVHEGYQSFFPPDVAFIADHAKRATSAYPLCEDFYYGVNYGERAETGIPKNETPLKFTPPHCFDQSKIQNPKSKIPSSAPNDLSWYANIPVPTSYMCVGSNEDFFGGYDHFANAGIIHIADHHIAPGKKQWTWGNHKFGYAWDRNLSDDGAPYIELMAGVFTDNQPDFSFLQPGETKIWRQYWYPIRAIGVPQKANLDAAISLKIDKNLIKIGVSTTSSFENVRVMLENKNTKLEWKTDISPDKPFMVVKEKNVEKFKETTSMLCVLTKDGRELISYAPKIQTKNEIPPPATEPLDPEQISSTDELYITGLHLEQYRHATRSPVTYWQEALKRDPFDSRCNNALGLFALRRGEFEKAESYFRNAIKRLTVRNPNPSDGEAFYNLGMCLYFQAQANPKSKIQNPKSNEVYALFYKSTWNQASAAAGFHALAELDCQRENWLTALEHLNHSLRFNADNLRVRNLKTIVLRKLSRPTEALELLRETLKLDPLDWWAKFLNGENLRCDQQIKLDIAHDFARAGFYQEAIKVLSETYENSINPDLATQDLGAMPLAYYTIGWFYESLDNHKKALEFYQKAAAEAPDYCFPQRLEEILMLEAAIKANPKDSYAPFYLGNLFYDRQRHAEAIKSWEQSAKINPNYSVVWRNLGIGYFNILKNAKKARKAYDKAFKANPNDARLLYERDQLWKRIGEKPERRLPELENYPELVRQRDDLTIELCALYNQTGQPEKALDLLASRNFQPWEGGEGQTLRQHTQAHLALGKIALKNNDFQTARHHFETASGSPKNLGEAKHLLANQSDIYYWLGATFEALNEKVKAVQNWLISANFKGDFQEMSVCRFSEMSYYSALSLQKLGQKEKAEILLKDLLKYAKKLQKSTAKIDYFATSLPTMLLFEDDIQFRQETTAIFLQAQANLGLGNRKKAEKLLKTVLARDPNHGDFGF